MQQLFVKGSITQLYHLINEKTINSAFVPTFTSHDVVVDGTKCKNVLGHPGYVVTYDNRSYFIFDKDAIVVNPADVMASDLLNGDPYTYLEGEQYETFLETCQEHAEGDVNEFVFTGHLVDESRIQWTFIVQNCLLVRHK